MTRQRWLHLWLKACVTHKHAPRTRRSDELFHWRMESLGLIASRYTESGWPVKPVCVHKEIA